MNIFMTGYSAFSCGSTKTKFAGMSSFETMSRDLLRELGHTVDVGQPEPDILDRGYDLLLVAPMPINIPGSRYSAACATLMALSPVPAFMILVEPALKECGSMKRFSTIQGLLSRSRFGGVHQKWVEANAKRTVEWVNDGEWPVSIAPAFPWGNHQLIEEAYGHRIQYFLDPSSLCPLHPVVKADPVNRRREWILGGVRNYSGWLTECGASWNISAFGPKLKDGYTKTFVPEAELVANYGGVWGVMSPPQWHTTEGSGWWRSRPRFAADAGCVLVCAGKEGEAIGPEHSLTVRDIEHMTSAELERQAKRQAEEFFARSWDMVTLTKKYKEVLNDAAAQV